MIELKASLVGKDPKIYQDPGEIYSKHMLK